MTVESASESSINKQRSAAEILSLYLSDASLLCCARMALATHPSRRVRLRVQNVGETGGIDGAVSRSLLLLSIGAVEATLRIWQQHEWARQALFEKRSNRERSATLAQKLNELAPGILEEDDLDDYLAIKYLRNTFTHTELRKSEQQHVISRRFPSELRRLDRSTWERVIALTERLVRAIQEAGRESDRDAIAAKQRQELPEPWLEVEPGDWGDGRILRILDQVPPEYRDELNCLVHDVAVRDMNPYSRESAYWTEQASRVDEWLGSRGADNPVSLARKAVRHGFVAEDLVIGVWTRNCEKWGDEAACGGARRATW